MSENAKKILVVVIAVVLLGGYVWWYYRVPSGGGNLPNGVVWLCQNKACGNVFRMTEKELKAHYETHYGQPVACPKCGKTEVSRGIECPHCKKIFLKARDGSKCPSCGKDIHQPPA
ncbi:MAG: hypothetical protein ACHRHE_18725 [Tepidisphaerales bacterium]